jgi:hypothetical protein
MKEIDGGSIRYKRIRRRLYSCKRNRRRLFHSLSGMKEIDGGSYSLSGMKEIDGGSSTDYQV